MKTMKFRTKLYVGFGTIIILLIIFSIIVFNMLTFLNRSMQEVVVDNYAQVKFATDIRSDVNTINRVINEINLNYDTSPQFIQGKIEIAENNRSIILQDLEVLKEMNLTPEARNVFIQIELLVNQYLLHITEVIQLIQENQKIESVSVQYKDADPIRQQLFQMLHEFNLLQEKEMDQALDQSNNTYLWSVRTIIAVVIVTLATGIGIAIWVFRSVSRSLRKVTDVIHQVAHKKTENYPRIQVISNDEIGQIASSYNEMAAALEQHTEQENEFKAVLKMQNWQKTVVAELTAKYQGLHDLKELAELFIMEVASAVGAGYGVFYIRQDVDFQGGRLHKMAAYAGGSEEIHTTSFALGEGLVGQCALENKIIRLSNPPNDYFHIRSGLGSAKPSYITLLPVQFESKVVAIIELASFLPLTEAQFSLLEELLQTLGITINSISGQMQVQKLLKESQVFTEELQTQSEELQMQQEELRTLNEQLEEQFKNSEQRNKELERIKTELEEKNEQIQLASTYKTEFLANMSHELRTPLNSMLILSQLLTDNREGNLTPKQIEFISTIYSSGSDLLNLINEILDLAKVESGKTEIVLDEIRVVELVDFAKNQFQPLAEQKGIRFDRIIQPQLGNLSFYSDVQKTQQVIKNLLSNAFKFTEQGSVTLQMRRDEERDELDITVSDTGIGIPKEKQSIIFDAFKQVDGTTSRKYGGTGLGLSITYKIVELLGGRIQVESSEGQGSIFTVSLPLVKNGSISTDIDGKEVAAGVDTALDQTPHVEVFAGELRQVPVTESRESLKGKKILLVDDDMRNIYALSTALESYEVNLIFAENGVEGIKMLQEHPDTDLILMDIMMPKMDGYEAMREIRKLTQYENLPIIALTAKAMKQDQEKCLEVGANDYISKPISLEQLLSLIRVWLHDSELRSHG